MYQFRSNRYHLSGIQMGFMYCDFLKYKFFDAEGYFSSFEPPIVCPVKAMVPLYKYRKYLHLINGICKF